MQGGGGFFYFLAAFPSSNRRQTDDRLPDRLANEVRAPELAEFTNLQHLELVEMRTAKRRCDTGLYCRKSAFPRTRLVGRAPRERNSTQWPR